MAPAIISRSLQSTNLKSKDKFSRSNGPNRPSNDWKLRLRSRSSQPAKASPLHIDPEPTVTTIKASSSPAKNRKAPNETFHYITKTKRKAPQGSESTERRAATEKLLSANNFDHIPYASHQNPTFKCEEPTKRKRKASPIEYLPDNGGSIAKRRKLTQKNLKLLEKGIVQEKVQSIEKNMTSSISTKSQRVLSAKRSCPSLLSNPHSASSQSARSYAATNVRFENALKALNVKFARREVQPDVENVKAILQIMEKERDSPEPDSREFYETLCMADNENEAMVTIRLTTLLIPLRDRPSNNHKTKDLLYRFDAPWRGFGSVHPGCLPMPSPDLCISVRRAAFTPSELKHMTSPYQDEAGFYPLFICEVKTAMQGPKIADRQNGNNAVTALSKISLDHDSERKILLITTAHNTRSQWYTGWFHVYGADGKTEWCSKLIKEINFAVEEENGFCVARRANLNLSERIQYSVLPQLHATFVSNPDFGYSNTEILAESRASVTSPPENNHIPKVDSQASSKRTKPIKRPATRSTTRPIIRKNTLSKRDHSKTG